MFSPPIDIKQALHSPAHQVSARADSSSERQRKLCIVTSFETDVHIHRKYKIPGTYTNKRYAVYSCVWRLGCFPGERQRGSWHFQVASLHLQSIKHGPSLCPLHGIWISTQAYRAAYAVPAERSAVFNDTDVQQ